MKKTEEQLSEESQRARDAFLAMNRVACKAESVAEELRELADRLEEIYEDADTALLTFGDDEISEAESKKDLDEDMELSGKLQE